MKGYSCLVALMLATCGARTGTVLGLVVGLLVDGVWVQLVQVEGVREQESTASLSMEILSVHSAMVFCIDAIKAMASEVSSCKVLIVCSKETTSLV